jgi:hypothetical protein
VFRKLRIAVLLIVLVNVGVGAWLMRVRTTSWERPVRVAVFPIAADGSPATAKAIGALTEASFDPIEAFFRDEARRHGLPLSTPFDLQLARVVQGAPPEPPFGGSRLDIVLWSLRLRAWVWQHGDVAGPKPHVRLFVLFHDPALRGSVPHSVGLQQGLVGVVHVFASRAQTAQNHVVMAHELLHTLGATDKYDPATNQPHFPDGYGDPDQSPRHPQQFAELMAGRLAISETESDMPAGLDESLLGTRTASEIGWRTR